MRKLRDASVHDAATLAALHGAHFPRAWSETEFLSFFERDGIIAYLAEESAQPIGFIFAWAVAGECELLSIAVAETHRQQGIASMLLEQAMADVKALGSHVIHLEVAVGNSAARAFYEHFGFSISHRRKDYYQLPDGTREDALTMFKSL